MTVNYQKFAFTDRKKNPLSGKSNFLVQVNVADQKNFNGKNPMVKSYYILHYSRVITKLIELSIL